MSQVFRYAIDKKFFPLGLPFGVRPSKDGVTITDDGRFVATYGIIRIETPLNNIEGAHVTSGYRWWTAIGARRSLVDDGLTFGTNNVAGVCIHFHDRVRSVLGPSGHSALTVTVADLEGLIAALDGQSRHDSTQLHVELRSPSPSTCLRDAAGLRSSVCDP